MPFFVTSLRATILAVALSALSGSCLQATAQLVTEASPDTTWSAFAPGVVSLPDVLETSPSVSTDGRSLLFARTEGWRDKAPYLATRGGNGWHVERATFADTIYNAALSPDGQIAFFKTYEAVDGDEVSRAYQVARTRDGWGLPEELPTLFDINAGYFCPVPDGTLYFFARLPKPGIYYAEPDNRGGFGAPQWLSDAVSPDSTTTFDVVVHPDEDRLIATRAGIPARREGELGPRGFYYYRRTPDGWQEERRLPLPYGWGATMLPGGRFLFVNDGDLQVVPLSLLGIAW